MRSEHAHERTMWARRHGGVRHEGVRHEGVLDPSRPGILLSG